MRLLAACLVCFWAASREATRAASSSAVSPKRIPTVRLGRHWKGTSISIPRSTDPQYPPIHSGIAAGAREIVERAGRNVDQMLGDERRAFGRALYAVFIGALP